MGLEIHERPRIYYKNDERIENNMVFTIEPGVYKPNVGGIRIEDMIVVTDDGYELLTLAPKKLDDIVIY